MASTSNDGSSHPVLFTTQTPYPLPTQKFMIPSTWKRYQLSQLINKALSLPKPIPFDFLVHSEILRRGSLGEWCAEKGAGVVSPVVYLHGNMVWLAAGRNAWNRIHRVGYASAKNDSSLPHEDWVSSVSCEIQGWVFRIFGTSRIFMPVLGRHFLTASYDGHIRSFDYSQKLTNSTGAHSAPISSLCVVATPADSDSYLLATSSHDLSARLTQFSLSSSDSQPIASLHLHTAPLSSITSSHTGSHLLTSSWDGLVGLLGHDYSHHGRSPSWPSRNQWSRQKETKEGRGWAAKAKRKAPVTVFKGHTARVSKVVFAKEETKVAYSCGFDSTLRTWDVENGICTNTIVSVIYFSGLHFR